MKYKLVLSDYIIPHQNVGYFGLKCHDFKHY